MFRFGGATHYTWNERNRLMQWIFSAFFNYMRLERAKMNLALVLRNNYIAERPFIPQKVSNLIPQFHQRRQNISIFDFVRV